MPTVISLAERATAATNTIRDKRTDAKATKVTLNEKLGKGASKVDSIVVSIIRHILILARKNEDLLVAVTMYNSKNRKGWKVTGKKGNLLSSSLNAYIKDAILDKFYVPKAYSEKVESLFVAALHLAAIIIDDGGSSEDVKGCVQVTLMATKGQYIFDDGTRDIWIPKFKNGLLIAPTLESSVALKRHTEELAKSDEAMDGGIPTGDAESDAESDASDEVHNI